MATTPWYKRVWFVVSGLAVQADVADQFGEEGEGGSPQRFAVLGQRTRRQAIGELARQRSIPRAGRGHRRQFDQVGVIAAAVIELSDGPGAPNGNPGT